MMKRIALAMAGLSALGLAVAPTAGATTQAPSAQTVATPGPLRPVAALDLGRYLGEWYQVAAIPQIDTLQCWSGTRATYGLVDADTISVRNECTTVAQRTSTVTGQADVLDPVSNAQLRVTFDQVPPFGDPSKPNYVVAALADDYAWALVGDPDRRSGFVLSRKPALSQAEWSTIKAAVVANGYGAWRFWTTPQPGGERLPQLLSTKA